MGGSIYMGTTGYKKVTFRDIRVWKKVRCYQQNRILEIIKQVTGNLLSSHKTIQVWLVGFISKCLIQNTETCCRGASQYVGPLKQIFIFSLVPTNSVWQSATEEIQNAHKYTHMHTLTHSQVCVHIDTHRYTHILWHTLKHASHAMDATLQSCSNSVDFSFYNWTDTPYKWKQKQAMSAEPPKTVLQNWWPTGGSHRCCSITAVLTLGIIRAVCSKGRHCPTQMLRSQKRQVWHEYLFLLAHCWAQTGQWASVPSSCHRMGTGSHWDVDPSAPSSGTPGTDLPSSRVSSLHPCSDILSGKS